jgi:hypothetical protein
VHDKLGDSSVTYQLEYIQCGKPRCRRWHGPYWYAYWNSGGRSRSLYIGKLLRPAAEVAIERIQRAKQRRNEPTGAKRSRAREKDNQLP